MECDSQHVDGNVWGRSPGACLVGTWAVLLGPFFCFYLVFLAEEIMHKIHIMPELLWNM